jgi:hypothetical protein
MFLAPKLLNNSATMKHSTSLPDIRQHNVTELNNQRRMIHPAWMGLPGCEAMILLHSHYYLMGSVSVPTESLQCMLIIENGLLILIS